MGKAKRVKTAGTVLLLMFILLALLHLLILLRLVPSGIVWGGRVKSGSSLFMYEGISLVVTLVFIWIVAIKAGYVKTRKHRRTASIGMWLIFAFMLLSAAGNLTSGVSLEKMIFTPVAVVMALLAFVLARGK